jgi:hypothetical protein
MSQLHNLLQATFRERRGVITLNAVPPEVGFALLRHFAWPRPSVNRKGPTYTSAHPSWKQGTSKGNAYHFIKFAHDNMLDVEWSLPLENFFGRHKTSVGPVRLVSKNRFQDARLFGTPVQYKYKWAVQRAIGVPTPGVHVFTITANITHVNHQDPLDVRFNHEYGRWVGEQQVEHIDAVKRAILSFPARPLRATHSLSGVVHPLAEWATTPTPTPHTIGGDISVSDDEDDDDDDDDDGPESDDDDATPWGGCYS